MKTLTTAALGLSLLIGSAVAATPKAASTTVRTTKTQTKSKKKAVKKTTPALRSGKAPGAVR
jgi:hypothetical protein